MVVQKSIREGFGLVVSESLWKGTPVVAGRAGGIPLQMPGGAGGRLVEDTEGCARAILELLEDRERRPSRRSGARASFASASCFRGCSATSCACSPR